MAAVALIVLALAGGSVATYFIMDEPRRQAKKLALFDYNENKSALMRTASDSTTRHTN